MFKKLLVANRGEIACRIFRSCELLGIPTVAVFSDADVLSPHVAQADEAVRIGPAKVSESYLNIAAILAAVRDVGADCVHPGYGLLSERRAFADAVTESGATFVVRRALRSKRSATKSKRASSRAAWAFLRPRAVSSRWIPKTTGRCRQRPNASASLC